MNTPGSSKSDPNRSLSRTPNISERYNVSEPPLSTRLEWQQSTPRAKLKPAPKVGRYIMEKTTAQLVSSVESSAHLSPLYDKTLETLYVNQVFENAEQIGQGSFGRVFRMTEKATNKVYAIKCATEPYRNNRSRREKLHEVRMHEKVPKHENLVKFFCAWEERDLLYIQTELCEMSLESHLHKYAPLPEWRVWDVFLDLTKAVHHLDTLNIIHADIKPANVLVSFDGVCKLGDFGLMVDLDLDDMDEERWEGDSKYLAREVLNSQITKEATIFSLGLSILQIATDLYLPSTGQRWHEIRDLNIDQRFTAHLTPDLVKTIYQMMATDPSQRPPITDVLNLPLLRDHDTNCRQWNRRFYCLFHNFCSSSSASYPTKIEIT
ncbi:Membrane-associated tyrosine- and threonine-specific cdc2-inhibitory kinase-like protein [Aphelenchoides bicaudatus]|nr:Membrane-associated tyrosine- and threonine-specific cdc2-inhibitory kinase-like protein [Aphelenchoides bicaudatus]